jgi:hypothetical protein
MMISVAAFIPLLLSVAGVAGWVLIRKGMRGRQVGDHPVCRKCGFDLFGLPEDRTICPECGGDLTARRAVVIGHRQRRPGMIASGAALSLIALTIVAVFAINVVPLINWQQLKPFAWVAWEARRGDTVAWAELTRRGNVGQLSKEQAQALIGDALAWQKDLTRVWKTEVGDFVEKARGAQLITDEQWATYAKHAPQLSLRFRDKVRKGDDLPGEIAFGRARAGAQTKLSVRIVKPLESDDPLFVRSRRYDGGGHSQMSLGGTGSTGAHLTLDQKAVANAPLGKRTVTAKLSAELRESWDMPGIPWETTLCGTWELVGKDEPTVEVVADDSPEMRKQMEAAVKVDKLEIRPSPSPGSGTSFSLDLKIAALPVPLSHDIVLRSGPREWKLSSLAVGGATSYGLGGAIAEKVPFDARRVDVIFRPSEKPAVSSVSITRRWDGEIVIPDVPVTWPATQPATK